MPARTITGGVNRKLYYSCPNDGQAGVCLLTSMVKRKLEFKNKNNDKKFL